MNHAEVHARMADYLEGGMSLGRRALFDAHLDGCSRCSREFAELRQTVVLLQSLEDPEPPPLLVENVMRRIRNGEGRTRVIDRLSDWLSTFASPRLALPATALAAGLLMWYAELDPARVPGPWSVGGTEMAAAERSPEAARVVRPIERLSTLRTASEGSLRPAPGRWESDSAASPADEVGLSLVFLDAVADRAARSSRRSRPSGIPGVWPPPAVARPPQVNIQIPVALVTGRPGEGPQLVARAPQMITRWPSRSLRGPAVVGSLFERGPAAQAVGTTPFDQVVAAGASGSPILQPSAFQPSPAPSERERRKREELEAKLGYLVSRPVLFAAEFASLSVVEQDIWLSVLADYAIEVEREGEVLSALHDVSDRQVRSLATAFAAEVRRAQAVERAEASAR